MKRNEEDEIRRRIVIAANVVNVEVDVSNDDNVECICLRTTSMG